MFNQSLSKVLPNVVTKNPNHKAIKAVNRTFSFNIAINNRQNKTITTKQSKSISNFP